MVYFEQGCASLLELFKSLPDVLPLVSPSEFLPPQIDLEFAQDEGTYPAFNKTMHVTFRDKSKGLVIDECSKGLLKTISTIWQCLKELEWTRDEKAAELVKPWTDALVITVTATGSKTGNPGMLLFFYSFIIY